MPRRARTEAADPVRDREIIEYRIEARRYALEHVAHVGSLYAKELERDDNLHAARLSRLDASLADAIEEAARYLHPARITNAYRNDFMSELRTRRRLEGK